MKILAVLGTRPEIIKTAPVLKELDRYPQIETRVCLSSQHKELALPFLNFFEIVPRYDLKLINRNLSPREIALLVSKRLERVFKRWQPDLVLVQGDTSTALGASLGASKTEIPLAHIEAGLRSPDENFPCPEEKNRRIIDSLAQIHFAPSPLSEKNLIQEGISPSQIFMTGNTGLDSFLKALKLIKKNPSLRARLSQKWNFLCASRKLIFSTFHRQENLGGRMEEIFNVLIELAQTEKVQIVYPVHPRPAIQALARKKLGNKPHIFLLPPLDYLSCVDLMQRSHLIITDSGGIQEEALVLGKPVILARSLTERPEGILEGAAVLAPNSQALGQCVKNLIADSSLYERMARPRLIYGNGKAAPQIARILARASLKPAEDKPRNHFSNRVSPDFPIAGD